jgi:hypothetical protein
MVGVPVAKALIRTLGYATELPGRKSSISGVYCKNSYEKGGASPPPFSNGLCGRRGPFQSQNRRLPAQKLYCVTSSSRQPCFKNPAGRPRRSKTPRSCRSSPASGRPEVVNDHISAEPKGLRKLVGHPRPQVEYSTELKRPRMCLRTRSEIFDFEPELGLKRSQTKPEIPGMVLSDRHTTTPNNYGPLSACFDEDPKLLNYEIAQPRYVQTNLSHKFVGTKLKHKIQYLPCRNRPQNVDPLRNMTIRTLPGIPLERGDQGKKQKLSLNKAGPC